MPLAPMAASPRILPLTISATAVPPVRTRIEPFIAGQLVQAQSAGLADLFGANLNKDFPTGLNGRYVKFVVTQANVAPAANTIGQTAAARAANGDVTGDLTIDFGSAAGDIVRTIPADGAFLAAEVLAAVLMRNGVPLARVVDAANPGVAQWAAAPANPTWTIVIGAAPGADAIPVGTEFEFFIPEVVGALARVTATGLAAGAALAAAGVPEERRLGVAVAGVDSAGRATIQLANVDIVAADVAAVSLICLTK